MAESLLTFPAKVLVTLFGQEGLGIGFTLSLIVVFGAVGFMIERLFSQDRTPRSIIGFLITMLLFPFLFEMTRPNSLLEGIPIDCQFLLVILLYFGSAATIAVETKCRELPQSNYVAACLAVGVASAVWFFFGGLWLALQSV